MKPGVAVISHFVFFARQYFFRGISCNRREIKPLWLRNGVKNTKNGPNWREISNLHQRQKIRRPPGVEIPNPSEHKQTHWERGALLRVWPVNIPASLSKKLYPIHNVIAFVPPLSRPDLNRLKHRASK